MFWSIGVFDGSGAYPACFLDAEVLNMTADTASRLSDGKWFCEYMPFFGAMGWFERTISPIAFVFPPDLFAMLYSLKCIVNS